MKPWKPGSMLKPEMPLLPIMSFRCSNFFLRLCCAEDGRSGRLLVELAVWGLQ